jgi:O-acetyl-ADP-ribose deacetylase (regulator of RNase III)
MHKNMFQRITVYIMDASEFRTLRDYFGMHPVLSVAYGNIFTQKADCVITAGQSFGMMDGGIDGHVNAFFDRIEGRVQHTILEKWQGELPVGASIVFPTPDNSTFRYLCYTPTMRVPEDVSQTLNAYLAMRGALVECAKHGISTLSVPLLCAGAGTMPAINVLNQIHAAYESFTNPPARNWIEIHSEDRKLRRSS